MTSTTEADRGPKDQDAGGPLRQRCFFGACLAHVLHDGYTDQLYALLPVWQSDFGLSYVGLAVVRALYFGTMGGLQVPSDRLASKLSPRIALTLATLIAASGYLIMALPFGFPGLCIGLILAGVGSSVQHPRASLLVTNTFGKAPRGPLSIYNFSGDLGKATFPAIIALLLPILAWRSVVGLMSLVGIVVGFTLLAIVPPKLSLISAAEEAGGAGRDGHGFCLLLTIGAFDTATRMGSLLFLPFLIRDKGGNETTIGIALALTFAGGALGKASCGWLGQHLGVIWSVIITEAAAALFLVATLFLPLGLALAVLPFLGIALNGTSSILYGTVPELARKGEVGRAFALLYTGVMSAGGLAPIGYGAIADHSSRTIGVLSAALTAAIIIPMVFALRPYLNEKLTKLAKY